MAPECPFPAAVVDAVTALQWIWTHGPPVFNTATSSFRGACNPVDAEHVFVCGDSAGGGLALCLVTALLLLAAEDGTDTVPDDPILSTVRTAVSGPSASEHRVPVRVPTAVGTFSAYTDLSFSRESYRTRAWNNDATVGDPVFSSGTTEQDYVADMAYAHRSVRPYTGPVDPTHPLVSPLYAPAAVLRALPPTFMLVGDAETMLGDTTELAARAEEAGVQNLTVRIYRRMWHDWVMYTEACRIGWDVEHPTDAGATPSVGGRSATNTRTAPSPYPSLPTPSGAMARSRPRLLEADQGMSEIVAFFKQYCIAGTFP
eukprot:m.472070 g.472070  ORF g.472070 m.472070 type:complete len:315 (+) comp21660_c0_seq6:399-1343(+)